MTLNEDLRKWFNQKWVDISREDEDGKHPTCGGSAGSKARKGGSRAYPKCVPASKAAKMSDKEKKSATRRKRSKYDGEGKPPKKAQMVSTKPKKESKLAENKYQKFLKSLLGKEKKSLGQMSDKEKKDFFNKVEKLWKAKNEAVSHLKEAKDNVPTDPGKWQKALALAKKKFKVWPSAYGSAFAAKEYKKMGGGWKKGTKKESINEMRDHYNQRLQYPKARSKDLYPGNSHLMTKDYGRPYDYPFHVKLDKSSNKTKADKLIYTNFIQKKEYILKDTGYYCFTEKRWAKAALELLQKKGMKVKSAVTESKITESSYFLEDEDIEGWIYEWLVINVPSEEAYQSIHNPMDILSYVVRFIRKSTNRRFNTSDVKRLLPSTLQMFYREEFESVAGSVRYNP